LSLVFSQVFPDILGWVEFGAIGRQFDQRRVFRDDKIIAAMPAGAVEHDDSVSIFGHMPGDLGQVLGHGLGVGAWHDEGGTDAPGWADGTEDVG
jgi:hypothetical protein